MAKNSPKTPPPSPKPAAPAAPAPAAPSGDGSSSGYLERHPAVAKLILVGVWIYVGALCLLALDQCFGWGIFGPKPPATP